MTESLRVKLVLSILLIIGGLIYMPGLSGPLLFDDKPALTANPLVQIHGGVFDEWRVAALSSGSGPLRRPITMLSFAANHVVAGGFSTFEIKAVNLGIHLTITILLYYLCLSILRALPPVPGKNAHQLVALIAAAIWLLHPLNVSTVLYAVQRMAQLSTLFILVGLLVFMHYRRRWADVGASAGEVMAGALWLLLLTLGATLSKENGALLPWLLVVVEVCIFRGVWSGRPNFWLGIAGWVALLLPIVLILLMLTIAPESLIGGYAGREFSLEERLLTQGRLLWRYLGWIALPNINDMGFQHDDIPLSSGLFAPWTTFLALVAWVLILVTAFVLRARYPLLLLGILFFLVGHSMESSVLPLEMVYEHRNYLPATLICLCIAYGVVMLFLNNFSVSVRYPVCGILAILCLLLFIRVQTWSDELVLSRTNLAQHPESSRSNYFYANALLRHYRHSEERDLSDGERGESLLLSRHYFERMHQTNDRDVAALVLLYYLDSRYFVELQEKVDWLAELEKLLDSRILQASDWSAFETLFTLFSDKGDQTETSRVIGLLDKLDQRYPNSPDVLRYRYQYLSALGADQSQLMPLLQRGQQLAPGWAWFNYHLIYEMSRIPDISGMYRYARQWLLHDPQRYHLHELKELFHAPDTLSDASGD